MGGGKMERVYHTDNQYFKFLDQQVKELHMERSQSFIKSVFRACGHKTRRRQVTGIPLMPMTIGSHTLATSATTPARGNLSKDITLVEVEARPLSSVPTTEEEVEESSNNNQLGESYVADVQHSGSKAPFHCTDVMTHGHLKNHFTKCLNDKIYNTFKDLYSNI